MLVVISDLHLSDETTSFNVNPRAFSKVLKNEIESNIIKNEIKEVRIILLGDIIDFVRSDYWLKIPKPERPWNGTIDKATGMNSDTQTMELHYGNLLNNILNTPAGKALIDTLNSIRKKHQSQIPVIINYVTGNHDRILNNLNSLQEILRKKLYEFDMQSIEFVNMYMNKEYSVVCRHGHEWDKNNYGLELYIKMNNKSEYSVNRFAPEVYKVQSIGEVITCELMSGLIYRLKDLKFKDTLKNLNNVRPLSDAILWIYWYGNEISRRNKEVLMKTLKQCLREVIETELSKEWDRITNELWIFRGDITDRFEQLLDLIADLDFDSVAKYVEVFKFFDNLFGASTDIFLEGAKSEFKNPYFIENDIQYILYGHTHEARNDYFDGTIDGKVRMYINTGTYLPYIQKTKSGNSFATADQLTMVFLYKKDEDPNESNHANRFPTLELWNGIKRKV